ncbi:MAG: hypothetical protein B7Z55_09330, partial [Planctomycetales bacterium 12-60-4]
DPSTTVALELSNQTVDSGIAAAAARLKCGYSIVGNVVYVGPVETTDWLRTTIEQREAAVAKNDTTISEGRKFALFDRKMIHWQDLDTPREILQSIADRYDLEIVGSDSVPHDLWASATIPYATAAESLSIVLVQLNLDFEWNSDGTRVRLLPYRLPALIEKRYPPRKSQTAAATLAAWLKEAPHLQGYVDNNEIVVAARVEDHERLSGRSAIVARQPSGTSEPVPLRRRKFTLRVENVPVRAVMRELEKSGISFEYDEHAFKEAKADLQTPISMDVKGVDADEFLRKLFAPVRVEFTIDDRLVRLMPAGS